MSTIKMSKSDFESKVIEELASIRAMLADVKSAPATSTSSSKEKKPRKPRDPDAPPNPWIVFTGKVRDALKSGGKPAGKQAQQFASYLKNEFPDAYGMDADEILAAHSDWTPPPAKPKEDESEDKATTADESKPKPKRTLSDEQKAKMAAGRKAAAERRKAEKDAGESSESNKVVEDTAPAVISKPQPTLKALPFKGKKYMWDPEGNGMWLQAPDGSKGAWAGTLAKDKKSIDNSTSDYSA
jgi:hypothetical protein